MWKRIICLFKGHNYLKSSFLYVESKTGKTKELKTCFRCLKYKYEYTGNIVVVPDIDTNKPIRWKNYCIGDQNEKNDIQRNI